LVVAEKDYGIKNFDNPLDSVTMDSSQQLQPPEPTRRKISGSKSSLFMSSSCTADDGVVVDEQYFSSTTNPQDRRCVNGSNIRPVMGLCDAPVREKHKQPSNASYFGSLYTTETGHHERSCHSPNHSHLPPTTEYYSNRGADQFPGALSMEQRPSLAASSVSFPSSALTNSTNRSQSIACISVEITPGVYAPLRGSDETWYALRTGNVADMHCLCCLALLYCISDAEYVLCPECKVISPVELCSTGVFNSDGSSGYGKPVISNGCGGVGLGVKRGVTTR